LELIEIVTSPVMLSQRAEVDGPSETAIATSVTGIVDSTLSRNHSARWLARSSLVGWKETCSLSRR
jgi:hypothetical protein